MPQMQDAVLGQEGEEEMTGQYVKIYDPIAKRSVAEHRVIVEQSLGRALLHGEVVHHKDHNKSNNDISNLQVMSPSAHVVLHRKEKAIAQGQPICEACDSSYVYVKLGGEVVCRKCGNVGAKPKVKR